MDSQVRLLPALIGAAAVVVVLRLVAMSVGADVALTSTATASAADTAPATPAAPTAADANAAPATGATAASAAPTPTTVQTADATPTTPAADKPSDGAGQAQNKGEADVLHALADRRAELDKRESELGLREQMLAATQKQVDDKIAELKAIQSKLDGMLAQRDDAQKAQLLALVKMYEAMKPDDAAKIFNTLDPRILTEVAGGMKPAKVGPVLAAMEPAKAQALTALLANRLLLPTPQTPVAAQPTSQTSQSLPTADASAMPALPGATPIIGAGAGPAAPGLAEPAASAQPGG